MPIWFFLSAIVAGLSAVILVADVGREGLGTAAADGAARGRGAVHLLGAARLRRSCGSATSPSAVSSARPSRGPKAGVFLAEIVLGVVIPLVLLGTRRLREHPVALFSGALLACGGVILNRTNVVVYALDLKGPIPQWRPAAVRPERVRVGPLGRPDRRDDLPVRAGPCGSLPILQKEEQATHA